MATQTVEDLQIKIGSDIKQALSGMNVVQKRLDQLKAQLEKGFAPKMDAMKAAMQNLSVPLEKTAQAVKKSANQIAKEQANLQSKLQIIEEKAQAQIATALLKEEAKRVKAQEIINKQAEAQSRLAEVSKAAADSIVQQQNDIAAAVQRATDKMQQQATGGFYKQEVVPRTGAKMATQIFAEKEQAKTATPNSYVPENERQAQQLTGLQQIAARYYAVLDRIKIALNKVGIYGREAMGQTAAAVDGARKSTDQATASTRKYGDAIKSLLSKVGGVFSSISKGIKSALSGAIKMLAKFGNAVKSTTTKASGMFGKIGETIKRVLIIGTLYKAFRGLFSFISNGIKAAISAPEIENMFNVAFGAAAASADEFAKKLKSAFGVDVMASKQMLATFQNFNISMGIGTNTAAAMSKSLTQLSYDMASLYEADPQQVFENLQSGLQGQPRALYKYGIAITEANVQQTALTHGIITQGQEMTSQQKILARYITILEQTGTSQGDLARTLQSPANQLRILKSQLDAAGRAIGQAFMPFIQAVLPWLNALAVVLERVGNSLARFTYRLFGKDFDAEMKKKQDALNDLQNSAGGAVGAEGELGDSIEEAGKKAKGALASFDKLNVVQSQSSDSADAGAGGGIEFPVPELPEPTGESPFEKMADQIIDFFKNHSFAEIGKILAEKLNAAIASVDWYALGAKIGYYFQQILEFAYEFLTTFDWTKFGTSIASSIMGFINAIDWHLFGSTIAEYFNSIFEFVYGFVTRMDWNKIGLSISNAIMGFFSSIDLGLMAQTVATLINGIVNMMYEAIVNTDWNKIAVQIGEAINKFFADVDWAKLGATIGAFFDTLVTFMLDLVASIDWGQIGTAIMTMFDNMGTGAQIFTVVAIGVGLVSKAIEIVVGVMKNWNIIAPIAAGVAKGLAAAIGFITSPVGLVIIAIGALIAVGVLLYKNWDK